LMELARGKNVRKPLRLLAIYALGETGDDRAHPVLEKLLHSRDRDIRDVAREAIEEWRTVTEMEQMTDDPLDGMDEEVFAENFHTDSFPDIWVGEMGTFSRN
jgi:HEAT repeat protein